MAPLSAFEDCKRLIEIVPTLPVPNPTISAWQEPPHPTIAEIQSKNLPIEVDVVIIGSGITGCSAANTLLTHPKTAGSRIAVLEARNAVSGATGRNGGHLISDVAIHYHELLEKVGHEGAAEIARFSEQNVQRLRDIIAGLDDELKEASEFRNVISTHAFGDEKEMQDCQNGLNVVPEEVLKHTCIGRESGIKNYHYKDLSGAVEQRFASALWPYRLITGIYQRLLNEHRGRFTLETNTPVLSIEHNTKVSPAFPYALKTPRGTILAKNVIHCTNGFTGRLVPGLVGRMFPLKGTMSVQKPGPDFPRYGDQASWSYRWKARYVPETKEWSSGLFYAQQNARTGDIWIGGETQTLEELLTCDDSTVGETASKNLTTVLPKMFRNVEPVELRKIWSGIMGFTSDGFPFIGNLTQSMTGRQGSGEWVSAGYNGHGMDKAWLSGDAVARMTLGEDVSSVVPRAYVLDEGRFEKLNTDRTVDNLMAFFHEFRS